MNRRIPTLLLALPLLAAGCASGSGGAAETAPGAAPDRAAEPVRTTVSNADDPVPTSGLYAAEQAERGSGIFNRSCADCHDTSEFRGSSFQRSWGGRTAGDMFDLISTTMPDDNPGGLPPRMYADVIAYVFSLNGYPDGGAELVPDLAALQAVRIPESGSRDR